MFQEFCYIKYKLHKSLQQKDKKGVHNLIAFNLYITWLSVTSAEVYKVLSALPWLAIFTDFSFNFVNIWQMWWSILDWYFVKIVFNSEQFCGLHMIFLWIICVSFIKMLFNLLIEWSGVHDYCFRSVYLYYIHHL